MSSSSNHHRTPPAASLSDRFKDAATIINKPDFRELDFGSPVSPLHATTSSSSSSSDSLPARVPSNLSSARAESTSHSGELSPGSSDTSPSHNPKPTSSASECLRSGQYHARTRFRSSASGGVNVRSDSSQCGGVGSVDSPPPVTVLPAGNICPSGKYKTGMNTKPGVGRRDVLGTGSGHYGHGSIMRGTSGTTTTTTAAAAATIGAVNVGLKSDGHLRGGDSYYGVKKGVESGDPEEVKRIGNDMYKRGNFVHALRLYDKAIALSPGNASYRSNRAAALSSLGRLGEAVRECEEAVKLDPGYARAHQRLGSLFIRLGMVEIARKHICFPGQQLDPVELKKLQDVETHLKKCTDARRACDWKRTLCECDAAIAAGADSSPQVSFTNFTYIAAGADSSPQELHIVLTTEMSTGIQLFACRAEALLKLLRLEDAERTISTSPRSDSCAISISQSKFFGILSEAYVHYVRAQIEMSLGRFDNAVTVAEKAKQIDARSREVSQLVIDVKLVTGARNRGNDLFKSERFTEACTAYGEGLRHDPSNSVLYCNRAACWFKIGQWERSIEDCNQALRIQPSYTKALLRRAVSNTKLDRWSDAVGDYEALRKILPDDNEIAKSLFHSQVALRKSRGEEVHNMKFGGEVEEVASLEQFRASVSSPGVTIVYFKTKSNQECLEIWPYVDKLCRQHPLVSFIKVDIEDSREVADAENVRIIPTFKVYKSSNQLKEMICPTHQVLECTVRHYSS